MYLSKVKRSMSMVFQEVGLRLAVGSPVSPQGCQTVTERSPGAL